MTTLKASLEENAIAGTDGYDLFKGYNGDNVYLGLKGADTFRDYSGNDIYIYNYGDGSDTIQDSTGNDCILFGEGITKNSLIFSKYNNNLHINIKETSDMLNIIDWINREESQIEKFEFSDGTYLTNADINNILNPNIEPPSVPPAESLPETTIVGNKYNNYLKTNDGNSVFQGKEGIDAIRAFGQGNDAYIFNNGDGQDTIVDNGGNDTIYFGEGIALKNLSFERSDNSLLIKINSSADQIAVLNYYKSSNYLIENIKFLDGKSISNNDIEKIIAGTYQDNNDPDDPSYMLPTPNAVGTDVYDYMSTYTGDNVYLGKGGSDWMRDSDGNDIYIYRPNDGQDTIKDYYGLDEIIFTGWISKDDLQFFRYDDNLHICVKGVSDKIDVQNWFIARNNIEKIRFEDGSYMTADEVKSLIQTDKTTIIGDPSDNSLSGTSGDDVLWGVMGNDTIYGNDGNDLIYSGGGNDIIYGNNGNDTILGESGNDTMMGGIGNDTYEGYFSGYFGKDFINDDAGIDYLDMRGLKSTDFNFQIFDNDQNGKIDGLTLFYDSLNNIKIMDYFDNTNANTDLAKAGTGCIETIHFANGDFDFADIHALIT